MLRASVNHFLPNSEGMVFWMVELNVALCLDTRANIKKYLIFSSGNRTHNLSRLQSDFVLLRHDWSLASL